MILLSGYTLASLPMDKISCYHYLQEDVSKYKSREFLYDVRVALCGFFAACF